MTSVPPTGPAASLDRRWALGVLAGLTALAVAALALPATLAYDPWAWLVWGRELVHLHLDTTGGPSWKPLPVALAVVLAPTGSWAPTLWLVAARVLGGLAVVGAYRLGRDLAGRVAGILAAGLLVLTPDDGPRFTRLWLEGHSATWTAALAVWAVERHLAGRRGTAGVLLALLALDRPEAWPFALAYGAWLAHGGDRRTRALVVAVAVAVPVAWFGGDWLGSGSPLHGADTAQVAADEGGRLGAALERAARTVVAPAVGLLALAPLVARRRRAVLTALVLPALGWAGLVVAMAAGLGYAALARFFLPAAALAVVAAAVATTDGWHRLRRRGRVAPVVAAVVLAAVAAGPVAARASRVGSLVQEAEVRAAAVDDLVVVLDELGPLERYLPCGRVQLDGALVPLPAVAWHGDVALSDLRKAPRRPSGLVLARVGGRVAARAQAAPAARPLQAHGRWSAVAVGCPVDPPGR